MCLILLAWKVRRDCPLVVAANRDEFYARPTAPAGFWGTQQGMLAGRDLKQGGTWLGVTREGRWAALTNYRDPKAFIPEAPSRGALVRGYLCGGEPPAAYLERIAPEADRYNGFSLLVGDRRELWVFSNRGDAARPLPPGLYGLSNRLLDDPWPKLTRGRERLAGLLAGPGRPSPASLLQLLADRTPPPDPALPDTGVGLEWERVLAPLFITSPTYGTRSSTVLMVGSRGKVTFVERSFNGSWEPWLTSRFDFHVQGADAQRRGPEVQREG